MNRKLKQWEIDEYYEEDREIAELRYRGRIDMLRNIQNMNTVELVDLIKSVLL